MSPETVCWELQDFTSYRLKVNKSLGVTGYYTHPGQVSKCQRHAPSSCPVFKVLQEFAAASPVHSSPAAQYTLWISFCVSPGLQSRRAERRARGCLSGHSCSSQPGNAGLHGQQPRGFLFRHSLSVPYAVEKQPPPNKANEGKFCLFIADNYV